MTLQQAHDLVKKTAVFPSWSKTAYDLAELLVSETAKARHQAFTEAAQIADHPDHIKAARPFATVESIHEAILHARDRV